MEKELKLEDITLPAIEKIVPDSKGILLMAHGVGIPYNSERPHELMEGLAGASISSVCFNILTETEAIIKDLHFNIPFLAKRLLGVRKLYDPSIPVAYLGSLTAAPAAIMAAAKEPALTKAVISLGGRPDLAEKALLKLETPTLLLIGTHDAPCMGLNNKAFEKLHCEKRLSKIEGAGHLFREEETSSDVLKEVSAWLTTYLTFST